MATHVDMGSIENSDGQLIGWAFMDVKVEHNQGQHRFEAKTGGGLALLEYRISGNRISMYHTEVPPAAGGKGIAGKLASTALGYAREKGLVVVPLCSFVADYIRKNSEYADLLRERS